MVIRVVVLTSLHCNNFHHLSSENEMTTGCVAVRPFRVCSKRKWFPVRVPTLSFLNSDIVSAGNEGPLRVKSSEEGDYVCPEHQGLFLERISKTPERRDGDVFNLCRSLLSRVGQAGCWSPERMGLSLA